LTFSANLAGTYVIQRTQDLVTWQDIQLVNYLGGVVGVTDNNIAGQPTLFYRAVWQ
jgi:hypothetical protein